MLKHLTVIELASVLAGPAVGQFFAELGAKVIKIENKRTNGDVTRKWKLPTEPQKNNISAYYCSVNGQKQSLFMDLTNKSDQQQVYQLVKHADIVIANFKTGDAQKLGMDYPTLSNLNPQLIYGKITAFGDESKRIGFDVVLQAESGFMYMNGEAGGQAVKMPVALIDILTAHQLKEGLLLALLKQQQTGKGSLVSVSLMETAVASLANQATNWLMAQHIPQRMGTLHPNIAPYGEAFLTKDHKQLVLAVGNDKQFKQFCLLVQKKDWITDERFKTNGARVIHRQLLADLLTPIFQQKDRTTWLELLEQAQVPAGAIRNMQEVFELPMAQNMVVTEQLEDGVESRRVKTNSFRVMS